MQTHMQRFMGRSALITGAASGIGAAVAERLSGEGARVGLIDVNASHLRRQVDGMRATGTVVESEQADVTHVESMAAAVDRLAARLGRLDILVHCAGVVGTTGVSAADFPVAEFRRVVDINLTGAFIACQCVLPHMLKNGYGRILLLA